MRRKPITEARRIVSVMGDPSVAQVNSDKLQSYVLSRDLEDLGDLDALAEPVTYYTVDPLRAEFRHMRKAETPAECWILFSAHVTIVDEAGQKLDLRRKDLNGIGYIDEGLRGTEFSEEVIEEIALYIGETASRDGQRLPFSPPEGWWELVRRTFARASLLA